MRGATRCVEGRSPENYIADRLHDAVKRISSSMFAGRPQGVRQGEGKPRPALQVASKASPAPGELSSL